MPGVKPRGWKPLLWSQPQQYHPFIRWPLFSLSSIEPMPVTCSSKMDGIMPMPQRRNSIRMQRPLYLGHMMYSNYYYLVVFARVASFCETLSSCRPSPHVSILESGTSGQPGTWLPTRSCRPRDLKSSILTRLLSPKLLVN